jgi:hypothetical protein
MRTTPLSRSQPCGGGCSRLASTTVSNDCLTSAEQNELSQLRQEKRRLERTGFSLIAIFYRLHRLLQRSTIFIHIGGSEAGMFRRKWSNRARGGVFGSCLISAALLAACSSSTGSSPTSSSPPTSNPTSTTGTLPT